MYENSARIVSLVPSWTETLVSAGLNVVGRTRYCIHPDSEIKKIKAVGGTKNFDLENLLSLKPDFVILDQEENKFEMAEQLKKNKIEMLISHVTDLASAEEFLRKISKLFESEKLNEYANRYQFVIENQNLIKKELFFKEIIIKESSHELSFKDCEYLIWKNPYMAIGPQTFIANVFNLVGIQFNHTEKYPIVNLEQIKNKYCFLSSEPYPFSQDFDSMILNGFKASLVDGEKISWYGLRNLIFLEHCLK